MGQVLPFHWMLKSAKAFGFRGASEAPLTLWPGALPLDPAGGTPVIGSRYCARHVSEPSHFSLRSDAYVQSPLAAHARVSGSRLPFWRTKSFRPRTRAAIFRSTQPRRWPAWRSISSISRHALAVWRCARRAITLANRAFLVVSPPIWNDLYNYRPMWCCFIYTPPSAVNPSFLNHSPSL